MPLEGDIQSFIDWAITMGYPIEDMPNDDALKSIFKSRQSSLFFNIMKRVRPRQKGTETRQNILVNKMENLKDQLVPVCKRSFLPREMQRYLKIQDLQKQYNEYETKLNEERKNCNLSPIKIKNMQKINMTNVRDTLKTKLNILELKLDSLSEKCNKEIQISKELESIMPVKLTAINSNETKAAKAVKDALTVLEEFYKIFLIGSNPELITETKEELWLNIKKFFSNIPNSIIWNIIIQLKEEQLQTIKILHNKSIDERNKKSSIDNITNFDVHMMKLKSSIIIIIGKYLSVQKQLNNINDKFTTSYTNFTHNLLSKIQFYCTDITFKLSGDEIDEILSDYIVEYARYNNNKGQINFLNSEIDRVKKITDDNQCQLDDHQVIIGSLKNIYNDIIISVQCVQQEIKQLTEINDKIYYTKSLLHYMLKDMQKTCNQNKNKLSTSVSSIGESFNISDNGLCSTKLDFDCTTISNMTIRGDNTLLNVPNFGTTGGTLPSYNTELIIFMKTPISKLHIMSKECWQYLLPNPLILESHDSLSTLQYCPGILLTTDGSIKSIKTKNEWLQKIKEISNEIPNNITLIKVNQNNFKYKIKQQREEIAEILDKIDVLAINTNRTLKKSEKYYEFILKNSLKNYIPRKKLFNNQTYYDYDAEYSMYYRIAATTRVSIQE